MSSAYQILYNEQIPLVITGDYEYWHHHIFTTRYQNHEKETET